MGLLDGLMGGPMDDRQRQMLMAMAAGLLGSRNIAQGASQGLLGAMQASNVQKTLAAKLAEEAQQAKMRDLTMQQMQRQFAQQGQMDSLAQRAFGPNPNQVANDDQGNPIPQAPGGGGYQEYAQGMQQIDPMKALALQAQLAQMNAKERTVLKPGEVPGTWQGNQWVPGGPGVPEKAPPGFTRDATGNLKVDPAWMAAETQLRQAGRPSVNVTTGTTMASELGKGTGEMLVNGKQQAMASVDAIQSAQQIRSALDSNKVMSGPGTTAIKIPLAQLAPMLGLPGNQEGLVKTREVITGMANQALAARGMLKGQGQVSDFEGKVLERAKAGNIDMMTVPEIRALLDVNDRLARVQIGRHNKLVDALAKNPEFAQVIPFYRVDVPDNQAPSGLTPAEQAELDQLRKRFGVGR